MLHFIALMALLLSPPAFAKESSKSKSSSEESTIKLKDPSLEKDTTDVMNDNPGKVPDSHCKLIEQKFAKKFSSEGDSDLGAPQNYFTQLAVNSEALGKVRVEMNSLSELLAKKDEPTNGSGASSTGPQEDPTIAVKKKLKKYSDSYIDLKAKECKTLVDATKSLSQFRKMFERHNCELEKYQAAETKLSALINAQPADWQAACKRKKGSKKVME